MELTLSNFFFDIPIYTPIQINDSNRDVFYAITDCTKSKEFEGYNPFKQLESTFIVTTDLDRNGNGFSGHGQVQIKCKRTDNIFRYQIYFVPVTGVLMKIGQYPSVADFHIS